MKLLKTDILHSQNNIHFTNQKLELPNGSVIERAIVQHPGTVAIVPFLEDGQVVLVRQYRIGAQKNLLEIPAGTRESDETMHQTIERELQEEAGYFPETIIELEGFYVTPGISDEYMYLCIARDLRPSRLESDDDEIIDVVTIPIDRALNMISTNEIRDAKTIIGLLRATSAF